MAEINEIVQKLGKIEGMLEILIENGRRQFADHEDRIRGMERKYVPFPEDLEKRVDTLEQRQWKITGAVAGFSTVIGASFSWILDWINFNG